MKKQQKSLRVSQSDKLFAQRWKTTKSPSDTPLKKKLMNSLQTKQYLENVDLHEFLREKLKTEMQAQPNNQYSYGIQRQQNTSPQEKERLRMIFSKMRFRQQTDEEPPQPPSPNHEKQPPQKKKTPPKKQFKVQLRNNQHIYEQHQKELRKQRFQNFISGEQNYFELLRNMEQKGKKSFQSTMQLRQKFYFDNLIEPERQFSNQCDLFPKDFSLEKAKRTEDWTQEEREKVEHRLSQMYSSFNLFRSSVASIKESSRKSLDSNEPMKTLLFKLVKLNQTHDVVEILNHHPELVNSQDEYGRTPLMISLMRGYTQQAQRISEFPVDIQLKDNRRKTAYDYGRELNQLEVEKIFERVEKRKRFDV